MKASQFLPLLGLTALPATLARPSPDILSEMLSQKRADSTKAGYLSVYWKTSQNGIFFAISKNADPLNFQEINGGQPVIVPTLGTKVARDISIVPAGGANAGSKWYILGTDLNISAVGSFDYRLSPCYQWTDMRTLCRLRGLIPRYSVLVGS